MKFYKIAFIYCNRKQINDFLGWKDWGRIGRGIIQELPKIVWVIDHDDGLMEIYIYIYMTNFVNLNLNHVWFIICLLYQKKLLNT